MTEAPAGISVLHVIVRAGATNSQYNEHCLPMLDERRITVCSLFPADVVPPPTLRLVEGDGTTRGCMTALRRALELDDYDIVHVHAPASGMLTLAAYLRARRSRRNLVFTVHNSWGNFRPRNRLFLRLVLALFPTVVVCGNAALDSMPWLLRKRRRRKLRSVPNGVDVDRIDRVLDEMAPSGPTDGFVVLSVNRLIPLKDPGTVLKAFMRASRPSAELVLVGEGALRTRIEDAVLGAHLHRKVTVTGLVERDQVYRMLAVGDAFVSASRGEGLPVAVLEAMACRCPVVLSDIPPHREIATAAEGVPLVAPGDVEGFARAIRRLMALSEEERAELGESQRRCVVEQFSVRTMNEAYGEIYMRVIAGNRPPRPNPRAVRTGTPPPDDPGPGTGLLAQMRRRIGLVIVLTALGAAGGLTYSQLTPLSYQGTSSVLVGNVIGGPADDEALQASASLATSYADLVRREPVLEPVARAGIAEDWRLLQKRVHAQTGDKNPLLVQITANAPTRDGAENLARAVSEQLVSLARATTIDEQTEFARDQLARMEREIVSTQRAVQRVQAAIDAEPAAQDPTALREQEAALLAGLADLQRRYDETESQLKSSTEGAQVSILEHAYAAPSPMRPDMLGFAGAGAGVGLALAAGWVYLRSRPRYPDDGAPAAAPRVLTTYGGAPLPLRHEPWAEAAHEADGKPPRRESKGR